MKTPVSITLPVADLAKSRAFFSALGFAQNPQFCGGGAVCFNLSESVILMLGSHATFASFSPKPICDPASAEVLLGIGCESRAQVDELIAKAAAAGGTVHEKSVDYGFMYHASFADPDGHLWALNFMSGPPPQA